MSRYIFYDETSKYAPRTYYANLTTSGSLFILIKNQWRVAIRKTISDFVCFMREKKYWVTVHYDLCKYAGEGIWNLQKHRFNINRKTNVWRIREEMVLNEIKNTMGKNNLNVIRITGEKKFSGYGDILMGTFDNQKDAFKHKTKIKVVIDVCGSFLKDTGFNIITRHKNTFDFYKRMNENNIVLVYAFPLNDLELNPYSFTYLIINSKTLKKYFIRKDNHKQKKGDIYISFLDLKKISGEFFIIPFNVEKNNSDFKSCSTFLKSIM